MYVCWGIVTKPVPSQESEWSCICMLGVSLPSLHQARKVSGHVYVCWEYRYQARKVSDHVYVCWGYQTRKVNGHVYVCSGYRYQACTKPGR